MRPDGAALHVVELAEWSQIGPAQYPCLAGNPLADDKRLRLQAEALRGRVDIRQGYEGLEIASTSFVGRVDLGPLRIAIVPKLPALPLAWLLRYAYGLRDIETLEETRAPTTRYGLHDLFILLLAGEVEELLHRGLARHYVGLEERLESPRGRILVEQIARQGGLREARLPCRHVERQADWHLNRVLRSGLESSARLASDGELRRRAHQLSAMFGEVGRLERLDIAAIDRAEAGLTRLTAASQSALTLIRLLHEAQGLEFDSAQPQNRTPGFLFDMNRFFQRLLSRFLRENLGEEGRIVDELAIRNLFAYAPEANPKNRKPPTLRPDYALFHGKTLAGFLDAKYRDVWARDLPPDWLYQLSIYALASPGAASVLLYASMSADACDERLEIRPAIAGSGKALAAVILRPVPLVQMANLLAPGWAGKRAVERRQLASQLAACK